jgi:hypothetical protein
MFFSKKSLGGEVEVVKLITRPGYHKQKLTKSLAKDDPPMPFETVL